MRLATWNICSARSVEDGRVDLDRFARAVAELDADVLALQEVDRDQPRSGGADLTAIAAEAMGATHSMFVPALYGTPGWRWTRAGQQPRDGPAYGCALLSRLPMRELDVVRIPAPPIALPLWAPGAGPVVVREEPRVAIVAELQMRPGVAVTVVATHLPFVPGWKRRALRHVVAATRARPDPLLLLGDLNLRREAALRLSGYRSLADAPTFPAPSPRIQLDHVLARGRPEAFVVARTATPRLPVSDHRPLVVELAVEAE